MFEFIFILPLSFFIGLLFKFSLALSHSYAASLVLLSLMVSVIIYPLQKLSDKLKASDDKEKAVFSPMLQTINKHYTGAERYYYTRYLNRISGYHPIKAMRSLTGLMIQIPFFMGAYHFLGHYQPLLGSSFFVFTDLGKPDGLLLGLNVLPLLMTVINILASSILLNGKPVKEKIPLYTMALLFLFLLYSSPSALVLYWTMNNFFSLMKTVITKLIKKEQLLDLSQLKKFFKPAVLIKCIVLLVSLGFIVIGEVLEIVHGVYFGFGGLIILSLLALYGFIKNFKKNRYYLAVTMVLMILALMLPFAREIHILVLALFMCAILAVIMFPSTGLYVFFTNNYLYNDMRFSGKIGIVASVTVAFLFFIFAPVAFTASDPLAIDGFLKILGYYYFPAWIVISCVLSGVYLLLPFRFRGYYLFCLIFPIFIFAIHGYFIPGNYAQMDGMAFSKLLIGKKLKLFDTGVYLVVFLLTFLLFSRKYANKLLPAVSVVLVSGLVYFLINFVNISNANHLQRKLENQSAKETTVYSFSKTKQNVVVFMLDRAFGFMTSSVFEDNPVLREQFDGFTSYPNCLSSSNATIGGFLSIMGGYDYSAGEILRRNQEPMSKKAFEAFSLIPINLKEKNYKILYSNVDYDPSTLPVEKLEDLGVRFNTDGNKYVLDNVDDTIMARTLLGGGLFRLAGDLFRKKIYQGGTWLMADPKMTSEYGVARKYYSQLKVLPEVSDTESQSNNFILIHNLMIHNPYVYGANGSIFTDARRHDQVLDRYPPVDLVKFRTQYNLVHYYSMQTSFQLLADWFTWMKKNDVYDNTKIIVVSDHGRDLTWAGDMGKYTIGASSLEKAFFVPLLLVKDFNEHGSVVTDMTFMTNADVPSLVLSHVGGGVNPYSGLPLETRKAGTALCQDRCHRFFEILHSRCLFLKCRKGRIENHYFGIRQFNKTA